MMKGRRVYDPATDTWSTGYWVPMYGEFGGFVQYLPVWQD